MSEWAWSRPLRCPLCRGTALTSGQTPAEATGRSGPASKFPAALVSASRQDRFRTVSAAPQIVTPPAQSSVYFVALDTAQKRLRADHRSAVDGMTRHSVPFHTGRPCGSVVRTSVFGWPMPDLSDLHNWHVTTSWVKCPLWVNQPDQLSLPSFRGRTSNSCGRRLSLRPIGCIRLLCL